MGITGTQRATCVMQWGTRTASPTSNEGDGRSMLLADPRVAPRGASASGSARAGVAGLGTASPATAVHPLLAAAKQTLGSVPVGREALSNLAAMGASVEVLPDDEYSRAVGAGSIGNTLTQLAGGVVTAKIRLRESAMRDPKLAAALLAHEIEHAYPKFTARSLSPGTEVDAERKEAAVKVALGIDPVAGNS